MDKWERVEPNIYRRGSRLYVKFRADGKRYTFPVPGNKVRTARRVLKEKQGLVVQGREREALPKRATFDELAQDYWTAQENKGLRSLWQSKISFDRARAYFKGWRAVNVTGPEIEKFLKFRRGQPTQYGRPPSPDTLRRDLHVLRAILFMGWENDKILKMPKIPVRPKQVKRKGFFRPEEFGRLLSELPDYVRPLVHLAYVTGMRRAELLDLAWAGAEAEDPSGYLDLSDGLIQLHRTKSCEHRIVPLTPDLIEIFQNRRADLDALAPSFPYVFFRVEGLRVRRILNFTGAWKTALGRAGLPDDRRLHDLRRSAVRNLNLAGVDRASGMAIVGHKTQEIHADYDQRDEQDYREAMMRLTAHNSGTQRKADGETN